MALAVDRIGGSLPVVFTSTLLVSLVLLGSVSLDAKGEFPMATWKDSPLVVSSPQTEDHSLTGEVQALLRDV